MGFTHWVLPAGTPLGSHSKEPRKEISPRDRRREKVTIMKYAQSILLTKTYSLRAKNLPENYLTCEKCISLTLVPSSLLVLPGLGEKLRNTCEGHSLGT